MARHRLCEKGMLYVTLTALVLTVLVSLLIPSLSWADILQVQEYAITLKPSWETMPRVGNDGISNLVVFTKSDVLPDGSLGKGDIWYQRLTTEGALLGAPVQVTSGTQDSQLNDVSGDYIVYTAYDSTASLTGRIMLYQISTGILHGIGNALVMMEPRISGNKVVWREGGSNSSQVMLYDLGWLGTQREADILAGPIPPTFEIEIGDRFVVWSELSNAQFDLVAYDLAKGLRINVTAAPSTNEREASTSGPWITWQAQDKGIPATRILARNMDTGEERTVVDNGTGNFRPSINGDLISYESNLLGQLDIYIYRISTGETFQVTTDPADQYLNDVFGNLVAYVDARNGNADIYVSKLTFVVNQPPVANAGADQTVKHAILVTLDGSASSDPDANYPLTYAWQITSEPAGSSAILNNPNLVNPSFTPDVPGDYYIQLIVTDALGLPSSPDEVIVSTTNTAPVADAGPNTFLIISLNSVVQLDGSKSYDDDGDDITYMWTMIIRPAGSLATLSDPTLANPTFVADVHGDYIISLVVTDEFGAVSQPDMITISFFNLKPIANAGGNQAVSVGSTVTLDGSGSSDANNDPLTYQWSIVIKPAGSTAVLSSPTSAQTSFSADMAGDYVISLVVNDGFLNSNPNNVTVTATSTSNQAIDILTQTITTINGLSPEVFKNPNMRNALTNKINAVLQLIDQGLYLDAIDKLKNDILKKTDGCATVGVPDKNDWIKDCAAQAQVYPLLIEAIQFLGG